MHERNHVIDADHRSSAPEPRNNLADYRAKPSDYAKPSDRPGLRLAGIAETGVRRAPASIRRLLPAKLPQTPDPRFPTSAQALFLVRGPGAERVGIEDGSLVIAIEPQAYEAATRFPKDGDLVVVRLAGSDGTEEVSIRQIALGFAHAELIAPTDDPPPPIPYRPGEDGGVEILGVVVRAIRIFGDA